MGGTWTIQNKTRPGTYINFVGVQKSAFNIGERGIAAIGLPLTWGDFGLIEVESMDIVDGSAIKKIGTVPLALEVLLSQTYKALVYNLNSGGAKADAEINAITATAKYNGTFGNKLSVSVVTNGGKYDVNTFLDNVLVETQTVTNGTELVDNDYIEWEGTNVTVKAATALSGGTDGTVTAATAYAAMFNLLKTASWQTLAIVTDHTTANPLAKAFIEEMRDTDGKKVQAALKDTVYDYEGVIQSQQGFKTSNNNITADIFPAFVAGLTAGTQYNKSNTAYYIEGATEIIGEKTNSEIIAALKAGQFVLSASADGRVKVEQDINSLHNFTTAKGYDFSKNRVIRTLDEIANTISLTFENFYEGKVNNNELGRTNFKSDLIDYFNTLQSNNAIQNFDSATDIEVEAGEAIDAVVINFNVQPVDSMEKLYITVNVG